MAIIALGITTCPLCRESINGSEDYITFPHFIENEDDPLWPYSDTAIHKWCFDAWPMKDNFLERLQAFERPDLIPNNIKTKVQAQFGAASEAYATSTVHAKGESLKILTDLITPQPNWVMLDVATAAGHTALAFAPFVSKVIATDITQAMVNKAGEMAARRGLTNVETRPADAEDLPFANNTFDLLTCRIAFHHFPHPQQALGEFARVLKPGGVLGFTDNVTVTDKAAAQYYNNYENLRDPSHVWVPSLAELQAMFEAAGFEIEATRQFRKEMEFHDWADRMRVSAEDKETLLDMMRNIPQPLEPLFMPRWEDDTMYFSLREVVFIAHLRQD